MDQGAVIKFYFKSGRTATEVHQDPTNVHSDDSRAQVFRWFARFQEGRQVAGG
jgi:hypothetical protein